MIPLQEKMDQNVDKACKIQQYLENKGYKDESQSLNKAISKMFLAMTPSRIHSDQCTGRLIDALGHLLDIISELEDVVQDNWG